MVFATAGRSYFKQLQLPIMYYNTCHASKIICEIECDNIPGTASYPLTQISYPLKDLNWVLAGEHQHSLNPRATNIHCDMAVNNVW